MRHLAPSEGANPIAELLEASDGMLYGTANAGGTAGLGTLNQYTGGGFGTVFQLTLR